MGLILVALVFGWGVWLADARPAIAVLTWASFALLGLIGWLVTLKIPGWRLAFALMAAFGLGGLRMAESPRTGTLVEFNDRGGLTLVGEVVEPPDVREARTLLTVQAERIIAGGLEQEVTGRALVHVPRGAVVRFGDRVEVTGNLVTPPRIDSFDYREFLGRSGVVSLLTRTSELRVVNNEPSPLFMASVHDLRQRLGNTIAATLPQPHAGLLIGVLVGEDAWIAPETMETFNRSGAAHVLVVSGYNMSLVAAALMAIVSPFPRLGRWGQLIITLAGIGGYALLVGGDPSTVRAAWMAGLVAVGRATGNMAYVPLSAAFSILIQTAYEPQILWSLSFQLSVVATLGLAFWLSPMKSRYKGFFEPETPPGLGGQLLRAGVDLFLTTACVLAFVVPLTAAVSGEIAWATLPVNLLIVPVQAILLMIAAAGAVLIVIFPPAGQILMWLCLPLVGWTHVVVTAAASLPYSTTPLYVPPWLVIFYWAVVAGVVLLSDSNLMAWHRFRRERLKRWTLAAGLLAVLVSVIAVGIWRARPDGLLHVWFLDAAGRNGTLIRTPSGGTILIDGGSAPVRLSSLIGERLPPNTQSIGLLMLSAPDEFETGAWSEVARRYPPQHVLTSGQPNLSLPWQGLMALLSENGRPVQAVTAGQTIETDDGLVLDVVWPPRAGILGDPTGASALVVRLRYDELTVLLPGNLDREGQSGLLERGLDLSAEVLVLPRHGEARSLEGRFLDAVDPQVVIVVADINRPPDPDLLAMLGGRTVYMTGRDGTLHLTSGGQNFSISKEP